MSRLIVVSFDNLREARKVRVALSEGRRAGSLRFDDAAVVQRDEEGNIDIEHEIGSGVNVGVGCFLCLLISFMFAGPLANIIIGTVGRSDIGSLAELDIETNFVVDVVKSLRPGSSALFVIVRDVDPAASLAVLKSYGGALFQTTLSAEAEDKLQTVLSSRD